MVFDPDDDVVPVDAKIALESAWHLDVPPLASALHARWWQLETWLRSLCYVELKARFGDQWAGQLPPETERRQARDVSSYRYMPSPDADDRLAHLDVGQLFPVIEANWDLFEGSLLDLPAWKGRLSELNKIRRQIAHCRRPHRDDLARLEQTLRDLDSGAFRALASFNRQSYPDADLRDSVVRAWRRGRHAQSHLIEHADRQYDTRFLLQYSRRPWAMPRPDGAAISGTAGYLWHATWVSGHSLKVRDWWEDQRVRMHEAREALVYACVSPMSVSLSFPAVSDPDAVADAIGVSFETVLTHLDRRGHVDDADEYLRRWRRRSQDVDPRVQVDTGWCIVDDSTQPITIFGA